MKARWIFLSLLVLGVGWAVWATGALAGKPCLPLSDAKGTHRIVNFSRTQVETAITNSFGLFRYRGLMLTDPVGADHLEPGWHPTNGFLLLPSTEILCVVPTTGLLGKRSLPYVAAFHITTYPGGTNQTEVVVRTVNAELVDGVTIGHGGTTGNTKKVQPIRREEESVLDAISLELNAGIKGPILPK